MDRHPIYLVTGPCGSGKTTWIHQQLITSTEPSAYICLGADATPIDLTYITATCPHVKPISAGASWTQLAEIQPLYVEIAPQLDLSSLQLPVDLESCQRIAIVPKGLIDSEYHDWATQTLISEVTEKNATLTASPRWGLTGEVLDPASLNVFWDELIQGAYGSVSRAKGIFEIVDGRAFYFSFGVGYPDVTYFELPLPPVLNGRPTRFSGLEVVGDKLQAQVIMETLQDCGLDDNALAYYQEQIRSQLSTELPEEVLV
ncbi:MAG: GTP-binding protein [Chamaesiphon sp.]|nr:GTP-binding protein [Chamaesiphon sp.]